MSRRGTILILVAGIASLMGALALAFLVRMRADAEEDALVVRDAQARMMLLAACAYVQEAARIGWDDPGTAAHEECFGWIDVRDGRAGPKYDGDGLDHAGFWPIGSPGRRFPMAAWRTPPYATRITAACNPIQIADETRADFGMPWLRKPDPQPQADTWAAFVAGDPRPVARTQGLAWFRLARVAAARFVVTCGGGGTLGYKDWQEVSDDAAIGVFGDEPRFEALRAEEARLWYEIEWHAGVSGATYQCLDNEANEDTYQWRPFNPVHEYWPSGHQSQPHARNLGGTIRSIRRLREPPAVW